MWRGDSLEASDQCLFLLREMAISGSIGRAWFVGSYLLLPGSSGSMSIDGLYFSSGCRPCVSEACSLYREGTYGSSIYPSTNCLVEAPTRQCRGSASINLANALSHSRAVGGCPLGSLPSVYHSLLKLPGVVGEVRVSGASPPGPVSYNDSYLVDPASSHMLVSKIKPCMSKFTLLIR